METDQFGASERKQTRSVMHVMNMIGFRNTMVRPNWSNKSALFVMAHGDHVVHGFDDLFNQFILGDGKKTIFGGSQKDVFVLTGSKTIGSLEGFDGENILDASNYALAEPELYIDLTGSLSTLASFEDDLSLKNINSFIGRKDLVDNITTTCDTTMVDSRGGSSGKSMDEVHLSEMGCSINMMVIASPNTTLEAQALEGNLTVLIRDAEHQGIVVVHYAHSSRLATEIVLLGVDLLDLRDVQPKPRAYTQDVQMRVNKLELSLVNANRRLRLLLPSVNSSLALMGDTVYVQMSTSLSVDQIIDQYARWADQQGVSMTVVLNTTGERVVLGHGHRSTGGPLRDQHTDTNVLRNDPEHVSHLVGGSGDNVFLIERPFVDVKSSSSVKMARVELHNFCGGPTNLLNLLVLEHWLERELGATLEVRPEPLEGTDLMLNLLARRARRAEPFGQLVLRNATGQTALLDCLAVQMRTMMRVSQKMTFEPSIIDLDKTIDTAVFSDDNVEPHATIRVHRDARHRRFFSQPLGDKVLVVMDETETKFLLVIYLLRFDDSAVLSTLRLDFDDQTLFLPWLRAEISSAPDLQSFLYEMDAQN